MDKIKVNKEFTYESIDKFVEFLNNSQESIKNDTIIDFLQGNDDEYVILFDFAKVENKEYVYYSIVLGFTFDYMEKAELKELRDGDLVRKILGKTKLFGTSFLLSLYPDKYLLNGKHIHIAKKSVFEKEFMIGKPHKLSIGDVFKHSHLLPKCRREEFEYLYNITDK